MPQEGSGRAAWSAADTEALARRIGPENVIWGEGLSRYAVDGRTPHAACFPATIEDVSKVVAWAHAERRALIPWGGGTQMDLGNPPERVDIVLCLDRLRRLVAYEPADMTVTVEAGMSLANLQGILAGSGQFLPVDPPLPAEATLGGILATRASGPLRAAYRTISDSLLGVRVVNADGRITKAGGRVVKNVAGYELGRLYAGSHGTLAVIVEATFKVQPRPEAQEALLLSVSELTQAQELLYALLAGEATPSFVELLGPLDAPAGGALLAAGFSGTPAEVEWMLAEAHRSMGSVPKVPSGSITRRPWKEVYPFLLRAHRSDASPSLLIGSTPEGAGYPGGERGPGRPTGRPGGTGESFFEGVAAETADGAAICRVHLLPTRLVPFVEGALATANRMGLPLRYAVHAASGVARLHLGRRDGRPSTRARVQGAAVTAPASLIDTLCRTVRSLREQAEASGGFLIVESAPLPLKERLPVFGAPRGDFFLHRAVKEKLDPHQVLSPGRFIGGL